MVRLSSTKGVQKYLFFSVDSVNNNVSFEAAIGVLSFMQNKQPNRAVNGPRGFAALTYFSCGILRELPSAHCTHRRNYIYLVLTSTLSTKFFSVLDYKAK